MKVLFVCGIDSFVMVDILFVASTGLGNFYVEWVMSNERQIPRYKCLLLILKHVRINFSLIIEMAEISKACTSNKLGSYWH